MGGVDAIGTLSAGAKNLDVERLDGRSGDSAHPGSLAQLAEQRAFNPVVQGSSPWRPTAPDLLRFGHRGRYLEIDRPRRLVFTWVSPGTGGTESVVSLEFTAAGPASEETDLRLVHERLPSDEARTGHAGGWSSILDRLAGQLT